MQAVTLSGQRGRIGSGRDSSDQQQSPQRWTQLELFNQKTVITAESYDRGTSKVITAYSRSPFDTGYGTWS